MLSTILFIDGTPVGYYVRKKGHQLQFIPTEFSAHWRTSPEFTLSQVDGVWLLDGEVERTLKQQVFQEVKRFKAAGLLE